MPTSPDHLLDPEALALLYVQQWLHEHGYDDALSAVEKKSGILFDDGKLEHSSQLQQLVWRHVEEQLAAEAPEEGSPEAQVLIEDEAMLRGGKADYPQTVMHTIKGVHPSSIVCVRFVPHSDHVVTGSGDGVLRRVSFRGDVQWNTAVGSGGVLCVDLHPQAEQQATGSTPVAESAPQSSEAVQGSLSCSSLLAAGSMDGSVTIVDLTSGQQLATTKAHNKYLVRLCWAGDGQHLVSCSHDQTLGIHRVQLTPSGDVTLETIRTVQFLSSVQDATFLQDGHTLVVGLRDTNYLRVMDLRNLEADEKLVNLNAAKDDHVSFFARHLVPSPCGRFLLVSTDTGRLLVLRTRNWELTRYTLLSVPTAQFHQFCAAWHRDSFYVFSGAAGAQVWVHHVGSGKVVAKLQHHTVNVRDLHYDPVRNLLATASFDKSVNILGYEPQVAQQAPGAGASS